MSDELQKIGFGANRTVMTVAKLIVREPTWNVLAKEMLILDTDGSTIRHMPSEERLSTWNTTLKSASESIVSGSKLIGVDAANFSNLTGDRDLQSVEPAAGQHLDLVAVRHDGNLGTPRVAAR